MTLSRFRIQQKRRHLIDLCQDFFLKKINRWLIQTLLLLTLFQQFTTGLAWLCAYQNDYVIDNYVEPAVI